MKKTSPRQSASGNPIVETAAITAFICLAVFILKTLAFLFIPLFISLLCCYILGAPLDYMKRHRVPEPLRFAAVLATALLLVMLLVTLVKSNVHQFQTELPLFEARFWEYADQVLHLAKMSRQEAMDMAAGFTTQLQGADLMPLGGAVQWLGASFFSLLGNFFGVILYLVFMLAEREAFSGRMLEAFGQERAPIILEALNRMNRAVEHYLGLKFLASLIIGILVFLALWLLAVPFALLCGVIAFILNFIPNLGALIAALPPVAIALFHSGSPGKTLIVALVFTVIQIAVGNVLETRLMGKGLNLSPLVVLLSLIFWGWLWGVTGMLISVPLTAAVRIALEQFETTRPMAVLMSAA